MTHFSLWQYFKYPPDVISQNTQYNIPPIPGHFSFRDIKCNDQNNQAKIRLAFLYSIYAGVDLVFTIVKRLCVCDRTTGIGWWVTGKCFFLYKGRVRHCKIHLVIVVGIVFENPKSFDLNDLSWISLSFLNSSPFYWYGFWLSRCFSIEGMEDLTWILNMGISQIRPQNGLEDQNKVESPGKEKEVVSTETEQETETHLVQENPDPVPNKGRTAKTKPKRKRWRNPSMCFSAYEHKKCCILCVFVELFMVLF